MIPTISLQGSEILAERFKTVSENVHNEIVKLMVRMGKDIARAQRGSISPGSGVRTGKYRGSIRSKFDGTKMLVKVGPKRGSREHPLAHLLERGHKIVKRDPATFSRSWKIKRAVGLVRAASWTASGRTRAIPHVFKDFDARKAEFMKGVEEAVAKA